VLTSVVVPSPPVLTARRPFRHGTASSWSVSPLEPDTLNHPPSFSPHHGFLVIPSHLSIVLTPSFLDPRPHRFLAPPLISKEFSHRKRPPYDTFLGFPALLFRLSAAFPSASSCCRSAPCPVKLQRRVRETASSLIPSAGHRGYFARTPTPCGSSRTRTAKKVDHRDPFPPSHLHQFLVFVVDGRAGTMWPARASLSARLKRKVFPSFLSRPTPRRS